MAHFLRFGGFTTQPSVHFDAIRYRGSAGVPLRGRNPLSDFVLRGMDLGVVAHLVHDASVARLRASTTRMTRLKGAPLGGRRTALLVTFAAGGRIKGHVPLYAEALARRGIDVVLIVATPARKTVLPQSLIDVCAAVYLRDNAGFDFAAWAHVILEEPAVLKSPVLYLTNDSIVGPVDEDAFASVLDAIDAAEEEVVGLTDNRLYAWHLQSFFLSIKKACLVSEAFVSFWRDVVNRDSKNAVILAYELTLTARLLAAGFSARALFPMTTRLTFDGNRTILEWCELLRCGFPFVKASLLIGEHRETAGAAVRALLGERGFDTRLFDTAFEHPGPSVEVEHASGP